MGLDIKQNKKGEFSLRSSVSNESYHPYSKYVSLEESKRIIIENAYYRFLHEAVRIHMEFPQGYMVNGLRVPNDCAGSEWLLNALKSDNPDQVVYDKFKEIAKELKLEI